jgi:hypothetical protein
MLAGAMKMKEIGLEAWIVEQEAQKAIGYVCVDIRCALYEISEGNGQGMRQPAKPRRTPQRLCYRRNSSNRILG